MDKEMTLDELKQVTIDYYVNLQRIKKADTGDNPELNTKCNRSIFKEKEAHPQMSSFSF